MALMLGHEWSCKCMYRLDLWFMFGIEQSFCLLPLSDRALYICWNDMMMLVLTWLSVNLALGASSQTHSMQSVFNWTSHWANERLHFLQLTVECRLMIDCSNLSPLVVKKSDRGCDMWWIKDDWSVTVVCQYVEQHGAASKHEYLCKLAWLLLLSFP